MAKLADLDEGSVQWEQRSSYPLDPVDLEQGPSSEAQTVHWTEQARHTILLLRLQKPYFIYCVMCSMLAGAAFLSTIMDLSSSQRHGRAWHDILEGGTWQSACWSVVGLALCAEVLSSLLVRGLSFSGDCWGIFDAVLLVLTVLAWALTRLRRASILREEAEEADLWLLFLRFVLQPCRVFATASMARKVQQMQQSCVDIKFDSLGANNRMGSGQDVNLASGRSPREKELENKLF
eukprot:TRINITY_DN37542_c0_g1_i1.p1 TRINITY_DN37542_c0_g1~~TRINITY_DN37542_c0_g1_i1.p1  ORF type:complete len:248 (-),score=56.87 TRINITY_DN37542_c0_g1_i1:295-999(-)